MMAKRGHKQKQKRWRNLGIYALLIPVVVFGASDPVFAQGSIFGSVQNSDATAPASTDLLWWGFLDDTDEEIRIESNTGAGYDGTNWFDDFQNYTTEAAGNPYDYYFDNLVNGESFHLAKLIPNNSFQQEDVVLAAAANPVRPTGLAAYAISSANVLIQWNGLPGITYHVYRRNTSNNGLFRRVDDPTGSLSNAGVADSYFVDATSDGLTNYTYIIIGEDASGNYSPHSAEVSVDASSMVAPTIASILPATGPTVGGTPVSITGTGFDPDGATVTIGGASATAVTVVTPFEITCLTPAGSGSADVVATNTSSALSTTPLVGGFNYYANTPPVANAGLDQLGLTAGVLVTLDGTGSSDIDGDSLSHSWLQVAGPAVTLSNNNVAQPTFTPMVKGTYDFELIVSDGITPSIPDTVRVTVNNQAPVLAAIGSQNIDEGQPLSFRWSASDPDLEIPTLTAENLPVNAAYMDSGNGAASFDFNPDYTQSGVYNVTFIASDGSLADTEVVAITVNHINLAPVLATIGPQSVTEGQNLNVVVSATDADGTIPALTAVNVPTNATFVDNGNGSGTFDFNPDFVQVGVYNVSFIASDGALADTEIVAVTVNEAGNQAPVLVSIGPKTVTEAANLNFGVSASDPDATIPTLTAENVPVNATFIDNGNGTGTFDFNPDYIQSGVYNVSFIASDGALADTEIVAVTVNDAGNQAPVLAAIGAQLVDEGVNLNFGVSANDPDATIPALNAENIPTNATFTDNLDGTGTFDFNPDYTQSGVYNVSFIASDGALADTEIVAITVNDLGNQSPVLAAIGAQLVDEGVNLNFGVSATDPDATIPVLTAENVPANATFTDNLDGTGTFDFNPDYTQVGVYSVSFIASDGALADTEIVAITVNDAGNQAPVLAAIGAQLVDEGQNLNFGVSASDPDATIPTLTAENVPVNATFIDNGNGTGTFDFNPDYTQSGVYNVSFIASDGTLADTEIVAVTVNDAGNQAPVLAAIGTQLVDEGVNLNFGVSATDPDATIPALTAENVPANATFTDNLDGTGTFDFNPDYTQSGVYNVSFIASDGALADTEIVAITVNDLGNQAPVLAAIGVQFVDEGVNLNFGVSATDPDATIPALTAENVPANATFTDNLDGTGTFDFNPDYTQVGVYNVSFIASDGALADTEIVAITVNDMGNQAPVLAAIGAQLVDEGVNLNLVISGSDPDATIPALFAENVPANATFIDNGDGTGVFDFTPDYTQAGVYNVRFIASDGALADTEIVDITVNEVGNQAPIWTVIGPQGVIEAQNLNFGVSATDPDATIPTLTAENVPVNATFTDNGDGTGVFDFTPDYGQAGLYTVRFIASDGALADTEIVDITVSDQNRAPALDPIGAQAVDEAQNLNFSVLASDPDATTPTLIAEDMPANATFTDNVDGTGVFDLTPDYTQSGTYDVRFIASDGALADTELVTVTVNDINLSPVLSAIGPQSVEEGYNLNLGVSASDPDGTIPALIAEDMPANATFTDNADGTGVFDFNADYTQSGVYNVRFIADDGTLADTEIVVLTVTEPGNQPPIFDPLPTQTVNEGDVLVILVHATDPEAGVLSINYVTELPVAAFHDSGNGYATLEYHPDYYAAGVDTVTFIATDDGVPTTSVLLDVEVITSNVNQSPILVEIGPQSVLAGDSLKLRIVATDSTDLEGNILYMTASNVPVNATFADSVDGIAGFVFYPDFSQLGLHTVTFRVTDRGIPALSDEETVVITVVSQNRPPVLDYIGPQMVDEGASLEFRISAGDPDGTIPVLSIQTLLQNYTFVDSGNGAGSFSLTAGYTESGLHELTFIADDGIATDEEQVILQIVEMGNQVPVLNPIGPLSVQEKLELGVLITASDLEDDSLIFALEPLLINSEFTDNGDGTALFTIAPDYWQDSTYDLLFTVSDGQDADSEWVVLTIVDAGNQLPVFDPVDPQTVMETNLLEFAVFAADPDSAIPILSTGALPGTAAFTDSGGGVGGFSWLPDYDDQGVHTIEFLAIDAEDPVVIETLFVEITVEDRNRPPVFTLTPQGTQNMNEGETLVLNATAIDPDGPAPEMDVTPRLTHMDVADAGDGTVTLTFTPDYSQSGYYQFSWVAVDAVYPEDSVFRELAINVRHVNVPPEIDPIAQQNTMEGDNLNFSVSASDFDGQHVSLSAEDLPANATFVDNGDETGTFDFNPDYAQTGDYFVSFIASDGSLTDTAIVQITVFEAGEAPVITPIGPQAVTEGQNLNVLIVATDVDATIPTLTAEDVPTNATFTDNGDGTGTFDFNPDFQQAGIYNVRFIAFDGFLADSELVEITVYELGNQAPTLSSIGPKTTTEGVRLFFVLSASDPDGQTPTLAAQNVPANASLTDYGNGTGLFEFTPSFTQAGVYYVTFIASDGILTNSEIVEITVNEAGNQPPIFVEVPGDEDLLIASLFTQRVEAIDPEGLIPTLIAENLPANATFTDSGNGIGGLEFTPDIAEGGSVYIVRFIASDGVDADTVEVVYTVIAYKVGDTNNDGAVNPVDVVHLVNYVYKTGIPPQPVMEAGDCNCDGSVNPVDVVLLANYVYKNWGVLPDVCP